MSQTPVASFAAPLIAKFGHVAEHALEMYSWQHDMTDVKEFANFLLSGVYLEDFDALDLEWEELAWDHRAFSVAVVSLCRQRGMAVEETRTIGGGMRYRVS